MDPDSIVHLVGNAIPALIGFLTLRSVKSVDNAIASLTVDVKALNIDQQKLEVQIAELRVRVKQLEYLVRRDGMDEG